jgi:Fe-S cluster assembly protein SufB
VIAKLSAIKGEPEFMLDYRLKAFRHWQTMTEPNWAQLNIAPIDYQSISYYSAPKKDSDKPQSLDEIDRLLYTFDQSGYQFLVRLLT